MKDLASKAKLFAILAVTAVLVVVGVLNLRDRLRPNPVPHDGIEWIETENGIQARSVDPESPLASIIKKGDFVRAFYYQGKYEQVDHVGTLYLYLEKLGVGGEARYVVEHPYQLLQGIYGVERPVYDVPFRVATRPQHPERDLYLAFIGLVYLAIGLFVLFKQGRAVLTYHFFAWSLISFAVYFYKPTAELGRLDSLVSLLDNGAAALLAPVFLHFCANFPTGRGLAVRWRGVVAGLYLPAIGLIVVETLYHYRAGVFGGSLSAARSALNSVEFAHLVLFFVIGGALLVRTYMRAQRDLLKHQLKWIIWGLGLSVIPVALLYSVAQLSALNVPGVSNVEITPALETLACVPLILIPLSFGYSIVRYRLMDVDVIMRRSFVHVAATVALGAIYMAVLLGVSDLVKFIWQTADLNSFKTKVVVVVGMLVVAMLFAPIKNRLQIWADRWFYGERYTLRTGLQDFGRTLAQTTALPRLLDSLARRLSEMLSTEKVGIFIADPESPSGFRLAHASGITSDIALPPDTRTAMRVRSIGRGFITAADLTGTDAGPGIELQQTGGEVGDELYYYVPCVVRDRMIAVVGVGKTQSGALLTSEDTDLLRALSGYVAVAIDNSLLYRSEIEKAEEMNRLREFSENIIESVNVGILAVDSEGTITTWNSALEEVFGISRERALRKSIYEVLDPDLVDTIQNVVGKSGWAIRETRHIYKFNASTEDGLPLTLNISIAPFEAARGVVTGTLVVIENVTERAQLEEQLLQREKLSSIGLLAAGVAHEVNTPLAGISSYAQMLLQQVSDVDPKHKLLEKIHLQTLRASGIVNNLLNFSRTGDAQFREVDVNQVLDDTLQLLEPQLRNSKVAVVRQYDEDLPEAYGNPSKLQQVFMNLILNARDAMPDGGRLTIHTRMVETSLVIDFRDTGIGIAPENVARIYDPFFTTKEVGQGTGLGLALSYGIIQEHGGRIFVESRIGEGAHFTIKLPTAFARHMQAASD
ncbi:MAG TPA: ATP-binding protein [Blastocatellia bacterium]|nr:ATP-binding protein [Blastocatellia bacterium]